MKRVPLLAFSLFLVLGIATFAASALPIDPGSAPNLQIGCGARVCPTPTPPPTSPPPDSDGDGVIDRLDRCPTVPGPASNDGCPLPDTTPRDRDGDGTADDADRCPDQSGPASNNGCPVDQPPAAPATAAPTAAPTLTLPILPTTGDCVVATRGGAHVNVRADASLESEIVASLDTQMLYSVLATLSNSEGEWERIAQGWVARWVVRRGGACAGLPAVQRVDPNSNPGPPDDLLIVDGFDFALTGGLQEPPEPDKPNACAGWGADWSIRGGQTLHVGFCDGSVRPAACDGSVHPAACDGSVRPNACDGSVRPNACDGSVHPTACDGSVAPAPTQWCVEPGASGKGFMINGGLQEPPEPDKPGVSIQWFAGLGSDKSDFPGELLIIAFLQPPGDSPLLLIWHAPADGAAGITLDWSLQPLSEPDQEGLMMTWWSNPGPPDAPQGIIIGSLWNGQGATVDWLPHSGDGGSLKIVDAAPAGAKVAFALN